MGGFWEEPDCEMLMGESRVRSEEDANQRSTKSDREPESTYSANGQKKFGAEMNQFTSMKSQKTGSVSLESVGRESTDSPRFFFPVQTHSIYKTVKGSQNLRGIYNISSGSVKK